MLAEGLALVSGTRARHVRSRDPAVCLLVEAAGGPGLVEAAGGPGPVEAAGGPGPSDALADALAAIDGVVDAVIADDTAPPATACGSCASHPDATPRGGAPQAGRVAPGRAHRRVRGTGRGSRHLGGPRHPERSCSGHVLDGNLHVNVLGADPTDDAVDDAVLRW